jgi:hypothetical protein
METLRSGQAFQALRLLYGTFANFHIKKKGGLPAALSQLASRWD